MGNCMYLKNADILTGNIEGDGKILLNLCSPHNIVHMYPQTRNGRPTFDIGKNYSRLSPLN